MPISRRGLLKTLVVAAVSTTLGYVVIQRSRPTLERYLRNPDLPEPAFTGILNAQTLQVLRATTEALIEVRIEMSHYENFFRWRSENLPGYKSLYEQFARTVNAAVGCNFAECDIAIRRGILEKAFQGRNLTSKLDQVRIGVLARDWLRFDKYIVREIFTLFAKTDAWIMVGYESWPGTSRGLVTYRQEPDRGRKPLS